MATEREAGVDRLILFSDGVMAIAITLLILPLTEIEPARAQPLPTLLPKTGVHSSRSPCPLR